MLSRFEWEGIPMEMSKKEENHIKITWLNRYRKAVREEQLILDEIQRLRESRMFPSLVLDGMPHGSDHSDLSAYVARMDEQLTRLKEWQLEKVRLYESISDRIRRVEDDNQRALLICRYIKGMSWEDIAAKLGYTWRHVHRIHSQALDGIDLKDVIECHSKSVI